jgi:cytochrome c
MKSIMISALVAAGVMMSAPAFASKDIAGKKGCLACHAVDKKMVGPSYQDVAAKYKPADEAALAAKIKKGTVGKPVYGSVPMPAQAGLTDDEAKSLAKWVIGGAK